MNTLYHKGACIFLNTLNIGTAKGYGEQDAVQYRDVLRETLPEHNCFNNVL